MVVVIPGLGDDIQAIKAGILEIGDLLLLTKLTEMVVIKSEH